jgi:TRAP-type C4-dicarboxylate transport system permease small subunit
VTIGAGLALIIVGAILAYAVEYDISGLDIKVVGVILMVGGLIGLVIGLIRLVSARRGVGPPPGPPTYEDRYYDDTYDYDRPPRRRY